MSPLRTLSRAHFGFAFILAVAVHAIVLVGVGWRPEAVGAKQVGAGGIEIALGPAGIQSVEKSGNSKKPTGTQNPNEEPNSGANPQPEPEPKPKLKLKPKPEISTNSELGTPTSTTSADAPIDTLEADAVNSLASIGSGGGKSNNDGDNTAGGGVQAASADYLASIQAWLAKHKRYPRRAKRRSQQGVVELFVKINARGEVLDYRIEKSSGYKLLDAEVKEMVERAQPFPVNTGADREQRFSMIVPVMFSLR